MVGVLFDASAYCAVQSVTSLTSLSFYFLAWASVQFILFIRIYIDVAVLHETYAPPSPSAHCLLQGLDL